MTLGEASKVVLVGDDLADGGMAALEQGAQIAEQRGAKLVVCHAIPDPGPIEALLGSLDENSGRELSALEERARVAMKSRIAHAAKLEGVPIHIEVGTPHSVVLNEARRLDARWVVVGASAKRAPEAWLLGSSAAQIVRHAPCTVLVVRPAYQDGPIVAATDLSDPGLRAFKEAVEEAKNRDRSLIVAHVLNLAHPLLSSIEPAIVVDEKSAEALKDSAHETLKGALDRFGGEGKTEVVQGSPKRAIVELAHRLRASLVVVGTHGRTGLARMALGSVAEAVVRNASCSVMVVREGDA